LVEYATDVAGWKSAYGQGRSVRYVTCAQLVNELAAAADEKRLSKLITRYGRVDLLLLDELGYVQLDTRGAELLFQILTEREERSSIATASNLPFSEWGKVITDSRLVAAIIDRLTFHAHIIKTGSQSYRLKSTQARRAKKS
jgi:DNA replication protein DnaC